MGSAIGQLSGGGRNGIHELEELPLIQLSRRPNAGAEVDSEGTNRSNGIADVIGIQAAGEEDGQTGLSSDSCADPPVVRTARTTEFLDRKRWITGIEQEGVDYWGHLESFRQLPLVAYVNDLYERNARQRPSQVGVCARR